MRTGNAYFSGFARRTIFVEPRLRFSIQVSLYSLSFVLDYSRASSSLHKVSTPNRFNPMTTPPLHEPEACSEDVTVTERGTSVTSPNYSGKYPSSARCVTSLATQSPLYCLKFTLKFLDLESGNKCPYDRVQIKCGNTVVKTFCGSQSSYVGRIVTCDKSAGAVDFKSDSSVEGRGFEIQVDRVRCSGK